MSAGDDYTVLAVPEVKSSLEANHIEDIINVASTGPLSAFVTSSFYPLLLDSPKDGNPQVTLLKGDTKSKPDGICIDISEDCKYIAIGHTDGSVSIWSVADKVLLKQIQQLHSKPITAIAFGHDSETLFVGDSAGLATWVTLSVIFNRLSSKEIKLVEGDTPVRQFCFTRNRSAFEIGFVVFDSRFITFDPKILTSPNKKLVAQANINTSITYLDPPCLHLIESDGQTPYLSLAAGAKFYYYHCSMDHRLEFIKGFDLQGGYIDFNIPISQSLIAFISKTGFLSLTSVTGKEIFRAQDPDISEIIKNLKSISASSEKLIMVTSKECSTVSFMGFEERLTQIAEKEGNWEAAFKSGDDVFCNKASELIGLPSNLAHRRSVIQDAMTALMTKYCAILLEKNEADDALIEVLKSIVAHCIVIEETEFLVNHLFEQFKAANRLTTFFEGIFGSDLSSDPLGICTAPFVSAYIAHAAHKSTNPESTNPEISEKTEKSEISEKSEKSEISEKLENSEKTEISEKEELKKAEDILLALEYEKGQAAMIAQVAYECKMYRLALMLVKKYMKDYALACAISLEAGPEVLLELITRAFFTHKDLFDEVSRRIIVVWSFFPEKEEFRRLDAIFNADWSYAGPITREFLGLLPIPFTFTSSLTLTDAMDAVLRVVEKYETPKVMPVLEEVCPIYAIQGETVTGVGLEKVVDWIFLSEKDTLQRQTVLKILLDQYPGLIPEDDLVAYSMNCGFIDCVLATLLPQKAYTQIFGTALLSPDFRDKIFDIIAEHVDEDARILKDAVASNFAAMLLTNPKMTVAAVSEYFPELRSELDDLPPLEKWLFLRELVGVEKEKSKEDVLMLFELVCRFDPPSAITFLNEHANDIEMDKAAEIAEKLGRVDCSINVLQQMGDYDGAVKSIGKEVQASIMAFEETVDDIDIGSVDELADNSSANAVIAPTFKTIRVAIDLLYNVTDSNAFRQWDAVYRCFQLPLYHMQKKKPGVAQAVVMLFSYFVVESLNVLSAETVFLILSIYFGALNTQQYRMLLKTIFSRIDYQKNLYSTVEELLTNDCLSLVDKAFVKITRGLQSDPTVRCQACQQPLSKGTVPFYVFPCGHCFHKQSECGFPENTDQKSPASGDGIVVAEGDKAKTSDALKCAICSGGKSSMSMLSSGETGKISTRRIQQLMRRLEFSLRKNYGENAEAAVNGRESFFAKKDIDEPGNGATAFAMIGIPNRSISVQIEGPEAQKS